VLVSLRRLGAAALAPLVEALGGPPAHRHSAAAVALGRIGPPARAGPQRAAADRVGRGRSALDAALERIVRHTAPRPIPEPGPAPALVALAQPKAGGSREGGLG
jgi:hypothetical protein